MGHSWATKVGHQSLPLLYRADADAVTAYGAAMKRAVSMDETLKFLHSVTLSDEELGVAADAMEYLVAVLGVAAGVVDDDPVH